MGPVEAKTKGIGFVNVKAFTEERFGPTGWDAALAQLVSADRRELEGIVSVGWYSLSLYARLIRAVDRVHGYGDLSRCRGRGDTRCEFLGRWGEGLVLDSSATPQKAASAGPIVPTDSGPIPKTPGPSPVSPAESPSKVASSGRD